MRVILVQWSNGSHCTQADPADVLVELTRTKVDAERRLRKGLALARDGARGVGSERHGA